MYATTSQSPASSPPTEHVALIVEPPESVPKVVVEGELKQLGLDECCAICLGEMQDPQPFPNADCPHQFCASCLSTLHAHLEGSAVPCPTCRRPSTLAAAQREQRRLERVVRVQLDAYNQTHDRRVLTFIVVCALTMALVCGLTVDNLVNGGRQNEVRSAAPQPPACAGFLSARTGVVLHARSVAC